MWRMACGILNEELNARFEGRLPLFDISIWRELRETIRADLNAQNHDQSYPMKPQRIIGDVRKALGDHDIVLSDVGAHKMWVSRYYQCMEPNTCLISNGFCYNGFCASGRHWSQVCPAEKQGRGDLRAMPGF